MRVLVVLNGAVDCVLLRRELGAAQAVVAADGAARAVAEAGGRCDAIVGDHDSITGEDLIRARERNPSVDVRPQPPEKDQSQTDAEFAMAVALERDPEQVVIVGALQGARLDHELGNVLLVANPAWRHRDVALIDPRRSIRLAAPATAWEGAAGDIVTLLSIGGDAAGVTTVGLQYALTDDRLPLGSSLGVSNVMTGPRASVDVRDGLVLVVHEQARPA